MTVTMDTIKADRADAKGTGDKLAYKLLTTLLGECETDFKRDGSVDVEKKVSDFVKGIDKTVELTGKSTTEQELEKALLESYLPVKMTEAALRQIILEFPNDLNIGQIMGKLNKLYKGSFDGKVASALAQQKIGGVL